MGLFTNLMLASAFGADLILGAGLAHRAPAAPRIATVSFSGNGCPTSAKNTISAKAGVLSFAFPEFYAALGGPTDPQSRTVNCQAHLNLDQGVPGYALLVRKVTAEGTLYSTPNVTLTALSTIFWSQDASNTSTARSAQSNEASRSSLKRVNLDLTVASPVPSKCVTADQGIGLLNINFRVSFTSSGTGGIGVFIGEDGSPVTEHVEFAWVQCGQQDVEFTQPS